MYSSYISNIFERSEVKFDTLSKHEYNYRATKCRLIQYSNVVQIKHQSCVQEREDCKIVVMSG